MWVCPKLRAWMTKTLTLQPMPRERQTFSLLAGLRTSTHIHAATLLNVIKLYKHMHALHTH